MQSESTLPDVSQADSQSNQEQKRKPKRFPRAFRIAASLSLIFCGFTAVSCTQPAPRERVPVDNYDEFISPTLQASATRYTETSPQTGTEPQTQSEVLVPHSAVRVVENPRINELTHAQRFAWSIQVDRNEMRYFGSATILEMRSVVHLDSNNLSVHKIVDGRAYFDILVLTAGHVMGSDSQTTVVLRKPELGTIVDETEIQGRLIKVATGQDAVTNHDIDRDASVAWLEVSFPVDESGAVQVPPWLGVESISSAGQLLPNTSITGFGYPSEVRHEGGVRYAAFTTDDPTIVASTIGGSLAASGFALYTLDGALVATEYANLAGINPDGTIDLRVVPASVIRELLATLAGR